MRTLSPLLLLVTLACGADDAATEPAPPDAAAPAAGEAPGDAKATDAPRKTVTVVSPTPSKTKRDILPEAPRDTPADVAPAVDHVKNQRWDDAIAVLDPVLDARPDDADARYWRGQARIGKKLWAEAEADLTVAVAQAPEWPNPRNAIGAALAMQKRCEDVIPHMDKLIELMPEQPHGWQNRGHCHYAAGNLPAAVADAQKACALGSERSCDVVKRIEKRKAHLEAKARAGEIEPPPYELDGLPDAGPGDDAGAAASGADAKAADASGADEADPASP